MEIANAVEAVQDGRIFIELINGPFLFEHKGSPAEIRRRPQARDRARLALEARERHGTYVKLKPSGADLFA
jgi:hypothetical protein